MLLAGGQGSRLHVLTANVAKPAVPFGGKYRLIDFPLSNCANSGIDTVGVLTQYQPHELHAYIGSGQPWDLDRLDGGVHILPPYIKGKEGTWYKGTANAIYQNIAFIEAYNPEYVLVLGGDHIYKMDYAKMLDQHKQAGADCTIAVIEVSLEEASRMGIMNVHPNGTIYEFEEKPKVPKSTLASMGIYIFTWQKLKEYLVADEEDSKSKNDFGANIIPAMLKDGKKLLSHRFDGYWRDVGTIDSLWEANMDMLSPDNQLHNTHIYARSRAAPPHFIGSFATLSHSLVTDGCVIEGDVYNSVLFNSVTVEQGAFVEYSILMPGAVVEKGAKVRYAIIAEGARICKNAAVGELPGDVLPENWGIAVVAGGAVVEGVVKAREMVDV